MKKNNYLTYLIVCLAFLILFSCSQQTQSRPSGTTVAPILNSSATVNSIYPTILPTIASSATRSPSPSNTQTQVPITETAPWTSLPTFSPEEARTYVADLLDTNRGCNLPCWWGITPGQTTWEEALRFLERFALRISIYPSSNVIHVNVSIPLPREVPYAYELFQAYLIQDGIVEEIEVYNYDFANHTYLPEFLETYGQPEEVYIRTEHPGIRSVGPFALALFYPSQGILMETPGGGGSVDEDIIRNCLRDMNWPFLYLWSPERQMSFVEAEEKYLSGPDSGYFLPLFDATGMTVAEFYDNFKDPNTTACLETPLDLWP